MERQNSQVPEASNVDDKESLGGKDLVTGLLQGIWKLHQEGQAKYEEGYSKGKADAFDEIKEWFEMQG